MKVYIIEKGWYSDRWIVGVTESEEVAKRIVSAYDYDGDSSYRVYDTDQFQNKPFRFKVEYWSEETWNAEVDAYETYSGYDTNTLIDIDEYIIFAKTKEQAIKIAQDMRAEYKAREEGVI